MSTYSTPTKEQAEEALRRIPTYQHRRVFYDALANPNWVRPLFEAGAFVVPAEPHVDEKGLIREVPWPEMQYLVRVAADAPGDVVDVLLTLEKSSNSWVRRGVFSIGAILPPEEAARLKPLIRAWRDQLGFRTDATELAAMTRNLLTGGEPELGLMLANILFKPSPTEKKNGTPETALDEYWYDIELPSVVEALGTNALAASIAWLENWEKADGRYGENSDITNFNRSDIATRDEAYPSIEQSLIDAVRDTAVKSFVGSPAETAIKLVRRPMIIIRKIALFAATQAVLTQPADGDIEQLASALKPLLVDPISSDHACRVEFADLYIALRKRGVDMDEVLTEVLTAGPNGSPERLREILLRRANEIDDIDKEALRRTENWQQRLLASIGAENLSEPFVAQLTDLDERNGPIGGAREPDFKFSSWSGPSSPVSQAELAELTPSELTAFLKTWHSGDAWMGPTHEGVARELTEVVTKNPGAFKSEEDLVSRLRPTYIRAIISGWAAYFKTNADLDWTQVMGILSEVIAHGNDSKIPAEGEEFDDDQDFSNAKQAAVTLLAELAKPNDERPLPSEVTATVATLLIESLSDAAPWTHYNEREVADDLDPLTISINWRWPIAVRGLINLVAHGPASAWYQNAADALDVELARDDKIGAAHAVVGEGLARLFNGAPEWLAEHTELLFGGPHGLSRNQQIALTTALATHRTHPKLLEFLRPSLLGAIELKGPVVAGWRSHQAGLDLIGHWIVVCLIWDEIKADDPLVIAWFGLVDPDTRGAVIGHIAWSFLKSEKVDDDIRTRLEQLWDMRAKHVHDHPEDAAELKDFYWFIRSGKFDPEWWLPRLREAAELNANLSTHGMIGEQLASAAPQMPREALEAVRLLMNRDEDAGILAYDLSEHAVPHVIAAALDAGDENLAQDALKLMNDLGAKGYVNLKDRVDKLRKK